MAGGDNAGAKFFFRLEHKGEERGAANFRETENAKSRLVNWGVTRCARCASHPGPFGGRTTDNQTRLRYELRRGKQHKET